jgi:hypothetical protein
MGVRIADTSPAYCSGCYRAKPEARHVDFDVVFDGPTFKNNEGVLQSMDDLILCIDCIREAAVALALDENPVRPVEMERDAAVRDAKHWKAYAEGLEQAQADRPEPVRRGPGRPPKRANRPEPVAA